MIVFQGVAHRRYRLEAGTKPQSGYPVAVQTLGPSLSDVLHEGIEVGAATVPPRYYRVVLLR